MRFRKRPVEIDAVPFHALGDHPAVVADDRSPTGFAIHTLENTVIKHEVTPGDWIVTGVKGEHYPVKPDIFEHTYERVHVADLDRAPHVVNEPATCPLCHGPSVLGGWCLACLDDQRRG